MPATIFYDIESLDDTFTLCDYDPTSDKLRVFYLVDDWRTGPTGPRDRKRMETDIYDANGNFHGTVELANLRDKDVLVELAQTYGLSSVRMPNNPAEMENDLYREAFPEFDLRPVCDTDEDWDPNVHPYLMGYNSFNYDTTMLAHFLDLAFDTRRKRIQAPSAKRMRAFNDLLFSSKYRDSMPSALECADDFDRRICADPSIAEGLRQDRMPDEELRQYRQATGVRIRRAMMMSGRHVDVARLNEKQRHVGLKRLLGLLGLQILEAEDLGSGTSLSSLGALSELVAYNVSDVVNLKELFSHPFYQGQFSLKCGLLRTYPELVYDRVGDQPGPDGKVPYSPVVNPAYVRYDRLMPDSSSAQFATKCLCPYDKLHDSEFVSLMYPSEKKAAELGIERRDILEEAKKFFYDTFQQPELRAEFDRIYRYYDSIRNKNFNDSADYNQRYATLMTSATGQPVMKQGSGMPVQGLDDAHRKHDLSNPNDVPVMDTTLFYYGADGKPTSCYVNFSVGGIHGIEYDINLFEHELEEWKRATDRVRRVQEAYPDPLELRRAGTVTIDDEEFKWSAFMRQCAIRTMERMTFDERQSLWKPLPKRPELFRQSKRKTKSGQTIDGVRDLKKTYYYTSSDAAEHEDFSSYYPSMLINLGAFENEGLGYDRYAEIYDNKQKYGKLMRDPSLTQEERDEYAVKREGTKLILNSASGAANARFENNILMPNNIIAMRVIGQLMAWKIGQTQTLAGARIVSTNTDGLYSCGLDRETNARILAQEQSTIGIEIEPEPMWLVSKDANNRLELEVDVSDGTSRVTGRVLGASGGIACHRGPSPTKALAHPAIVDWALVRYLTEVAREREDGPSLDRPFDREEGTRIMREAFETMDPSHLLLMFGNVVASSPGTMAYVFASSDPQPSIENLTVLQHYNRVYVVKEPSERTVFIHRAQARKVTPATMAQRTRNGEPVTQHDLVAARVLALNGLPPEKIVAGYEARLSKLDGISHEDPVLIENRNLSLMDESDRKALIEAIDVEHYLTLVEDGFEKNWRHRPAK